MICCDFEQRNFEKEISISNLDKLFQKESNRLPAPNRVDQR
jgi:hypothetical protein